RGPGRSTSSWPRWRCSSASRGADDLGPANRHASEVELPSSPPPSPVAPPPASSRGPFITRAFSASRRARHLAEIRLSELRSPRVAGDRSETFGVRCRAPARAGPRRPAVESGARDRGPPRRLGSCGVDERGSGGRGGRALGRRSGMSQVFIGIVFLAIVGGAAESGSAIAMACRNRIDLVVGIALGSYIQIALFVAPILV